MKFYDKEGNILEFDIVGYQFNGQSNEDKFNWDANWLNIKIIFDTGNYKEEYYSSCILTIELNQFVKDLERLIKGKTEKCIMDTLEPYFKINIVHDLNEYKINICFIYDKQTGNKIELTQIANEQELKYIYDEFKSLATKYKER